MALDTTILALSPVAYWKCDETSGTTLADSSGNSNDLTTTGSPTLGASGQVGNAVTFNGSSQYASRTSSVIGSTPSSFTLIALVKGSLAQAAGRVISFGNHGDNNPIISLLTGATAGPTVRGFWRNSSSTTLFLTPHGGIAFDNAWHMVALQVDSTTATLWVDDLKVSTASYTSSTTTLTRTAVGALLRASAGNFFAGTLQHVAVWTAKLTDGEIEAIFAETGITPYTQGPFSLTSLGRSDAELDSENAQGVAYDGTHYYTCAGSASLKQFSRSGNTYTQTLSRNAIGDLPSGATQANGIDFYGGSLWLGANDFATGHASTKDGWVLEFDPSDLTLLNTYSVGNDWCEGGAWKDNEFWAIFHNLGAVRRYDNSFSLIAQYTLPFVESDAAIDNERGLYQGAQWYGDYFLCQTHRVNPDPRTDVYEWTGSGFNRVQILPALDPSAGQGIHWESLPSGGSGVLLFAERDGPAGNTGILRATFTEDAGGVSIPILAYHYNHHLASMG